MIMPNLHLRQYFYSPLPGFVWDWNGYTGRNRSFPAAGERRRGGDGLNSWRIDTVYFRPWEFTLQKGVAL